MKKFNIIPDDTSAMKWAKDFANSHSKEEIINEARIQRVKYLACIDKESADLKSICLYCLAMAS